MYVLDSDHVSFLFLAGSREALTLRARMRAFPNDTFATTVITFEELMRGRLAAVARTRDSTEWTDRYTRLRQTQERFCEIHLVDFDEAAAVLLRQLQRVRIGAMDLRIAAIVLTKQAILLTRNKKDFSRVPELQFEDWTIAPEQEPA